MRTAGRWTVILTVGLLVGCHGRSLAPDSSFGSWFKRRPPASRATASRTGRDRDRTREVSQSPAEDPLLAPSTPPDRRGRVARDEERDTDDFEERNSRDEPPARPRNDALAASKSKRPAAEETAPPSAPERKAPTAEPVSSDAEFDRLRSRLDQIGATFHLEQDGPAGEFLFHCKVPYPDVPDKYQAFEARHKNKLKAAQAVTDEAERWVAQAKRTARQ